LLSSASVLQPGRTWEKRKGDSPRNMVRSAG
jgi:hypothetical protein